ncbi:MAG: DUF192 domain-containing protein [Opitutaceae bacterium]
MKNANLVYLSGLGLALLLATVACGTKEPAPVVAPKTVADFFPIKVGNQMVRMQVAVLQQEQMRGLMERTRLADDQGMIFIFRTPQQMSFWMHDTPTPLDIGFFDAEGALVEIYPLLPFDEKTVTSRSRELKFALEMNQNWYRDHGVKPGAKIDLKALAAAVRARDFEPRKLGLDE